MLVSAWCEHAFCAQMSSSLTCGASFSKTWILILGLISWFFFFLAGYFQNVPWIISKSWRMWSLMQSLGMEAISEKEIVSYSSTKWLKAECMLSTAQWFWFRAKLRWVLLPGHRFPPHLKVHPTPVHNMECYQSRDAALEVRRTVLVSAQLLTWLQWNCRSINSCGLINE